MEEEIEAYVAKCMKGCKNPADDDSLAHALPKLIDATNFDRIPLDAMMRILSRTNEKIETPKAKTLLSKFYRKYGNASVCLLPFIDCGDIGAAAAALVLSSFCSFPLIREITFGFVNPENEGKSDPKSTRVPILFELPEDSLKDKTKDYLKDSPKDKKKEEAQEEAQEEKESPKKILADQGPKIVKPKKQSEPPKQRQGKYNRPQDFEPNFMKAIESGNKDSVKYLIEKDIKLVNHCDDGGFTPLHCAAWKGQVDIARLLLKRGAKVNVSNNPKWTPLHFAAYGGHLEIAELLVKNGAEKEARNTLGMTSLFIAAIYGRQDVLDFLIQEGADVNTRDNRGKTVLSVAHDRVRKSLISHGAE